MKYNIRKNRKQSGNYLKEHSENFKYFFRKWNVKRYSSFNESRQFILILIYYFFDKNSK